MCRLVAYTGPPRTLASLLCEPEHALVHQSYAPRRQTHGRINADGFGAGWYAPDVRSEPARYRTTTPMWADRSFASIAGVVRSSVIVGAVRNATIGLPVDESCTPPYTSGPWLFAHNGKVDGFSPVEGAVAKVALRRQLSDERTAGIEGATDSEVVFALVLDRIDAGTTPQDALTAAVLDVAEVAPTSRLNLILTDGNAVLATAYGDTLFTLSADDSVVVASEPFDDDDRWQAVPDRSLVVACPDSLTIGALS
jgi:glutamine amidotransferase